MSDDPSYNHEWMQRMLVGNYFFRGYAGIVHYAIAEGETVIQLTSVGPWIINYIDPEAFTLWVFVFDDAESEDWTGAFLGGGHVFGGPKLTLSGSISKETEPFLGDKLNNPGEAEIHLAVTPHSELDPDKLPSQIKTPSGSGPFWWVAVFD